MPLLGVQAGVEQEATAGPLLLVSVQATFAEKEAVTEAAIPFAGKETPVKV